MEKRKSFYLFFTGEFDVCEVMHLEPENLEDEYTRIAIKTQKPTSQLAFPTEELLVQYVAANSYNYKNIEFVQRRLIRLKDEPLHEMTTKADQYFLQLESGNVPDAQELKEFFNKLVNFLEKKGGIVKEETDTKEETSVL